MMEVSQSAPPVVDFKDMVQSKPNGLLSPADIIDENIDTFCLGSNNEENTSKNLKDIKNPVNGEPDLDTILNKDDNELVDNFNPGSVNGVVDGANLLVTDDIDMFAEEFLKEIEEEDKTQESLSDHTFEDNLLKDTDDGTSVQDTVLSDHQEEMKISEDFDETEKENHDLKDAENILEKLNDDSLRENSQNLDILQGNIGSILNQEEEEILEENSKKNNEELRTKTDEAKCFEAMDVDESFQDALNINNKENNDLEETNISEIPDISDVNCKNSEINKQNDTANEGTLNELLQDKETDLEMSKLSVKNEESEKKEYNEDIGKDEGDKESNFIEQNQAVNKLNNKDLLDKSSNEEDSFMNELTEAIGDSDPNETSIEENQSKAKGDCDVISLDSPLASEVEKNKLKTDINEMKDDDEVKSTLELSSDRLFEVQEIVKDNKKEEKTKEENDLLLHSDDDDIMLIDSINEDRNVDKSEDIRKNEDTEKEECDSNENLSAKDDQNKLPPGSDSEDDDCCVVLDDNKFEEGNEKDKDTPEKQNKNKVKHSGEHSRNKKGDENISDDDVVLLDEEEKTSTNKDIDHHQDDRVLEESKLNDTSQNVEDKEDKEKILSEKKMDGKEGYASDDDIVLLDDDEKDEKESRISNKSPEHNILDNDEVKENDTNEKVEELVEENKEREFDEDDDDVVLLDDEKEREKEDKKEEENDVNDDNNVDKNSEDSPVEEEIFSFDTSVTKRRNEESISKSDDDDDVVLVNESSQKCDHDKKEEVEEKIIKDVNIENKDEEKLIETETESNKVSSRRSSRMNSKESEAEKDNVLVPDNSDNAQDKFPEKSTEDDSSNNEGDNFLLQEVEPPQNSHSNDDEKNKFSSEIENSENSAEPPVKKVKRDDDDGSQSSLLGKDNKEEQANNAVVERDKSLKRSLSSDSVTHDSKKQKTENVETEAKDNVENVDKKEEVKLEGDELLVPTPKPVKKVDLNLDFLKRFKKSISKMTKADLEELVLQKIVEAIIHKSEFSEMRDTIEKQEKIISTHRTKIAEITKQFRDLEMVHNRVLKDLEIKNQQFIMPVKITRAVGLQVLIPKRFEQSGNKTSVTDRPIVAPPTTPPTPIPSSSGAEVVKRKCPQKITPLRPDTTPSTLNRGALQNGLNSAQNTAQISTTPVSTPQNQVKMQQKIISRSTPVTSIPQQNMISVINQQIQPQQYLVQQATLNQITVQNQVAMQSVRKSTSSRQAQQTSV